jgi:hypothetical protein
MKSILLALRRSLGEEKGVGPAGKPEAFRYVLRQSRQENQSAP